MNISIDLAWRIFRLSVVPHSSCSGLAGAGCSNTRRRQLQGSPAEIS
jgi:hypothetical protein